jgi:hypothetical protein
VKQRHRVLVLLAALSVITYLDRVCISVAGPRIQNELHLSPQYDAVLLSMAGVLILGAVLWIRTDATETLVTSSRAGTSLRGMA